MRILKGGVKVQEDRDRSEGHIVLEWESVEVAFEVRLEGAGTRLLKTESGRRAGKGFHRAAVENTARLSRESPSLLHGLQS